MTRLLALAVLVAAVGCTRYEGPLEVYRKNRVPVRDGGERADSPGYTIPEQKERARERLTTIEDDRERYPGGQVDRPGGIGR